MKKVFALLFACAVLLMAQPLTARADIGPKPSVRITFTGISGETYYGTLLSERKSTGPASVWDGRTVPYNLDQNGGEDIWRKFVGYEDGDGYYFLQEWWDCSGDNQLNWTYYPPSPFKILLYFPESDSFCVSPVYERYAFDSYFTVDLSDYRQKGIAAEKIAAEKSYDYGWELISFAARVLLTILLELAVALLFGYRGKKEVSFLAIVNLCTQLGLNLALNLVNYNSGPLAFTLIYIPLELAVFAVEAVLYAKRLPAYRTGVHTKGKAVAYAFVANAFSYAAGLWLAHVIPGIM